MIHQGHRNCIVHLLDKNGAQVNRGLLANEAGPLEGSKVVQVPRRRYLLLQVETDGLRSVEIERYVLGGVGYPTEANSTCELPLTLAWSNHTRIALRLTIGLLLNCRVILCEVYSSLLGVNLARPGLSQFRRLGLGAGRIHPLGLAPSKGSWLRGVLALPIDCAAIVTLDPSGL